MKGFILFLAVIFTIVSCDSPRDRKATLSSNSGLDLNSTTSSRLDVGTSTSNTSGSSTTTTTTTATSTIPADAQHCKFATDGITGFESTSTHLGAYTLCQSSTDKNVMYFQLKTPVADNICFIPTTSSGSNSIYVGNPMCGQFTTATQVRKITFVKFSQYTNSVINGSIFFKDLAFNYPYPFNNYAQTMTLDAYKTCMYAISLPPYYNAAYCQAFKQVGQYVYKQF
jgi:hypothetical protein